MPRKKQLKAKGSEILSFSVEVSSVKSQHSDAMIDIVDLKIQTNEGEFCYQINSDDRAPDLLKIRHHIDGSLQKAKSDYLKVEISEYTDRFYLFFNVQDIGQQQYTGRRI
ncbi:MAG: hypothetical protein WAO71_06395 [Gallionella sp.]